MGNVTVKVMDSFNHRDGRDANPSLTPGPPLTLSVFPQCGHGEKFGSPILDANAAGRCGGNAHKKPKPKFSREMAMFRCLED